MSDDSANVARTALTGVVPRRAQTLGRAAQWRTKQILEWLLALVLLLLTLPLQLLIALAIRLDSPGPVLFVQERLGRGGRLFRLLKFRTMRWEPNARPLLNADGSTRVEDDDARLTRVGRWLRVGWDELPQLVNVLRGEMVIIGPRPDQPFHRRLYTPDGERKLLVLPGITGLPQVVGRNEIPWKERIQLDLTYVDNYSLWLDFKIVYWTLQLLLGRKRVNADYESKKLTAESGVGSHTPRSR